MCGDRGASEHMHACMCEWLIEEKMFNILHYEELLLLHIHLHVRVYTLSVWVKSYLVYIYYQTVDFSF